MAAGVHLLLPLPDHADDEAIAAAAAEQSIRVVPCRRATSPTPDQRDDARRAASSSATPACRSPASTRRRAPCAAVVRSMTAPSPRARAADARGLAATGPQPARDRLDADAAGRLAAYPAAMMGKRHSETTATLPDVRPSAAPGPATTAQEKGSTMIHPSDPTSAGRSPSAMARARRSPVPPVAAACRADGRCVVPLQPDRGPRRPRLPGRLRRCRPRLERSRRLDRRLSPACCRARARARPRRPASRSAPAGAPRRRRSGSPRRGPRRRAGRRPPRPWRAAARDAASARAGPDRSRPASRHGPAGGAGRCRRRRGRAPRAGGTRSASATAPCRRRGPRAGPAPGPARRPRADPRPWPPAPGRSTRRMIAAIRASSSALPNGFVR